MENILITGGDGYIGHKVALNYLKHSDCHLYLWVRAKSEQDLEKKNKRLADLISSEYSERYTVCFGDLEQAEPFDNIPADKIHKILHTAAVIRFNVEEDLADSTNILGTRKICEFAKNCDQLKAFDYLSTVYSSGMQAGVVEEKFMQQKPEFVNHYERSKYEAEKIVVEEFSDLPWNIIRIATVISDDMDGKVTQYNVFHNTMRLLFNGLISLLPGDKATPLYLITGEFAANTVYELMESDALNQVFHVCHEADNSASLNDLITWVFEVFNEYPEFSSKRILPPIFADEKTFMVLANNMQTLSKGILSDALGSITPFAKQLYITKEFKIDNTRETIKKYQRDEIERTIKNTTRYLVNTKWGRL
jgi:thioester reductase-like protein